MAQLVHQEDPGLLNMHVSSLSSLYAYWRESCKSSISPGSWVPGALSRQEYKNPSLGHQLEDSKISSPCFLFFSPMGRCLAM